MKQIPGYRSTNWNRFGVIATIVVTAASAFACSDRSGTTAPERSTVRAAEALATDPAALESEEPFTEDEVAAMAAGATYSIAPVAIDTSDGTTNVPVDGARDSTSSPGGADTTTTSSGSTGGTTSGSTGGTTSGSTEEDEAPNRISTALDLHVDGFRAEFYAGTSRQSGWPSISARVDAHVEYTNPDPTRALPAEKNYSSSTLGGNASASVMDIYTYDNAGVNCLQRTFVIYAASEHEVRFSIGPNQSYSRRRTERCDPPVSTGGTTGGSGDGGGGGGGGDYCSVYYWVAGCGGGTGTVGGSGGGTGIPEVCSDPHAAPWGCDGSGQILQAPKGTTAPDDPCEIDPSTAGCPGSGVQFASSGASSPLTLLSSGERVRALQVVFVDAWTGEDGIARVVRHPNGGRGRPVIYLPRNAATRGWVAALSSLARDEATTGASLTEVRDIVIHANGRRGLRRGSGQWEPLSSWRMDRSVGRWNWPLETRRLREIKTAREIVPAQHGSRRGAMRVLVWQFDVTGTMRPLHQSGGLPSAGA